MNACHERLTKRRAKFAAGMLSAVLATALVPVSHAKQPTQYETALNRVPTRDSLLAFHQQLAKEPHVAGSPGDARVIEFIEKTFIGLGLETTRFDFWAYLAEPVGAELEVVSPELVRIDLRERPLPGDRSPAHAEAGFAWNAYSGNGDVTSQVVYAHYGTKSDFSKLKDMGVDCTGKIVIARYGANFRGYKAKFAQAAGAAGLIIFTDPADSGYMKGLTYPEGGYANECCVQRGSILTLDEPGDPLTPGFPATEHAERLDPGTRALPTIPVQPVSYAAAKEIMSRMTGEAVPEGWQGGLPFTYRLTGGENPLVRMKVEQRRSIKKTSNIIGVLRGVTEPDRKVIVGCHHDAWVNGAADPTCGTICLIESARSYVEASRLGNRPRRSIVFCAWGAEEFSIIGSTEWVEANASDLIANGVAYINLDMASMGVEFGASASPSLRTVIEAASKVVPQARGREGETVFDAWSSRHAAGGGDRSTHSQDERRIGFGDVGGGSDHVAFLCHCCVPSCGLAAGGSKGFAYHSAYDSLPWYWKVVGDDYESALMVTRMTNAVALRLADERVIPLDPMETIRDFKTKIGSIGQSLVERGLLDMKSKAEALTIADAALGRWKARLESGDSLSDAEVERLNRDLIDAERVWFVIDGLEARSWYRNLYAATDEDSGYASWILPELRRAGEHADAQAAKKGLSRLIDALERSGAIAARVHSAP